MSVALIGWALKQTTGSYTRKAVLLALADHANGHTGQCNPQVETMAAELEMSEKTVRRALVALETSGLIARTRARRGDGSYGGYSYSFPPADSVTGGPPDSVTTTTGQADRSPPVTESGQERTGIRTRSRTGSARAIDYASDDDFAGEILATWNELADQRLTARSWLRMIKRRVDEHPELDLDAHEKVIGSALANPWWAGAGSPSVVYGSDAQFERSIAAVADRAVADGERDQAAERFGRILAGARA